MQLKQKEAHIRSTMSQSFNDLGADALSYKTEKEEAGKTKEEKRESEKSSDQSLDTSRLLKAKDKKRR